MSMSELSDKEEINKIKQSIILIENNMEELFYSLIAFRVKKSTLEEIVEFSVLEFFKIGRLAFHGKSFVRCGQPINIPQEDRAIMEGRKWFVSIMRYILLKSTYTLKLNYPFYNQKFEFRHRSEFMGAINPKTQKDHENREILLGLGNIIKRICLEEGVLDERLQLL